MVGSFNKIVAVASLKYKKVTFAVHSGAWLVHLPHRETEARRIMEAEQRLQAEAAATDESSKQARRLAMFMVAKGLFAEAKAQMMRGVYAPALDARLLRAAPALPWLQGRPLPVAQQEVQRKTRSKHQRQHQRRLLAPAPLL